MSDNNTTTGNYIFRLHNDGASDMRLEDWGRSAKLDSNKIKTIKDVLKKGAAKIATSVPSPFARMHLFDTAFRMVADELEGDSVYHQLVSDCMDVFQLLFQSGNKDGDLKFRAWNRAERIAKLRSRGEGHPHKLLADSLEMFFTGKFAGIQNIALIYYKGILLGGTSPLTVFFTSPNWQREMIENNIHISSTTNHDEFFDMDFRPLHGRDPMFVEFMFRFYLAYRNVLTENCEGLAAYIRNTIERHKKELARKATDEWSGYINNPASLDHDYQRIAVIPNSSVYLQTGSIYGFTVKSEDIPTRIQSDSDFIIEPKVPYWKEEIDTATNTPLAYKPLVLARGMNVAGTYTYDNTPWNSSTDIRRSSIMDTFGNPVPLSQRLLPGNTGIKYPFLTTEDFLEDALIKMPYKLHKEKFYTGYGGDFQYLLPIKKEYFNFFSLEDLKSNLTILTGDSRITVQLRIPVRNTKGNTAIIFTKDYEFDKVPVALCNAGMAVFPFYRITDDDERLQALNEYTVLFADGNDKTEVNDLTFWQIPDIVHKKKLDVSKPEARTRSREGSSYYYKPGAAFDVIELKMKDERQRLYSGIILPEFKPVTNRHATKHYTFSIDFGTSNSHIAYLDNENDRKPKTFEIAQDEVQTVLLNAPGEGATAADRYNNGFGGFPELKTFVNREFVPVIIGKSSGSAIAFPVRTATAEKKTFQSEQSSLFHNISIGFFIDVDETKQDNCVYQTNLKWRFENSLNHSDPDRIEAFLKELLLIIRNKVVTTGGSLGDTRIVWLRPLSMKERSVDLFASKWQKAFDEVFKHSGAKLQEPITESIAPYFYLKNNSIANVKDFADAINIDIGGGTTDVMFFMRRTGSYLSTSFRFAGNDIWGDGLNRNEKDNGFIQNFKAFRAESRKEASAEDRVLEKFLDDPTLTSEDVVSLLFRYDSHFKFTDSVNRQKPQLKLVLFLHYSAIVYHLAQIIEQKDLSIPRYFTFTGKGSQYLLLMCSKDALTRFTKMLLTAYTARLVPTDFQVVLIDNPKEATANGATLFVNSPDRDRINKDAIEVVSQWGAGPDCNTGYKRNVTTIRDVNNDAAFKDSVLSNLQTFVEKTLGNEQIATFLSEYEIKGLTEYSRFLTAGDATQSGELYDSFYSLLENMRAAEGDGISETFFFLPLKDALYALSKKITS